MLERITLDFDGGMLVGVFQQPERSTASIALLLHGGPGGTKEGPSDLYVRLAKSLAEIGIASVRFDFFGQGESGGDYITTSPSHQVAQYRHMVEWIKMRGFERLGVVGESFGGTCALDGYQSTEIDALVLLWPAIWLLDGTFAPIITEENQAILRDRGFFECDGYRVGPRFVEEILVDSDREKQLRKVTSPTLLIHGDADSEVPVHQSRQAFDILAEPKRLVVVSGADHCLRRPDEQTLAMREIVDWLRFHLDSKSPSE